MADYLFEGGVEFKEKSLYYSGRNLFHEWVFLILLVSPELFLNHRHQPQTMIGQSEHHF